MSITHESAYSSRNASCSNLQPITNQQSGDSINKVRHRQSISDRCTLHCTGTVYWLRHTSSKLRQRNRSYSRSHIVQDVDVRTNKAIMHGEVENLQLTPTEVLPSTLDSCKTSKEIAQENPVCEQGSALDYLSHPETDDHEANNQILPEHLKHPVGLKGSYISSNSTSNSKTDACEVNNRITLKHPGSVEESPVSNSTSISKTDTCCENNKAVVHQDHNKVMEQPLKNVTDSCTTNKEIIQENHNGVEGSASNALLFPKTDHHRLKDITLEQLGDVVESQSNGSLNSEINACDDTNEVIIHLHHGEVEKPASTELLNPAIGFCRNSKKITQDHDEVEHSASNDLFLHETDHHRLKNITLEQLGGVVLSPSNGALSSETNACDDTNEVIMHLHHDEVEKSASTELLNPALDLCRNGKKVTQEDHDEGEHSAFNDLFLHETDAHRLNTQLGDVEVIPLSDDAFNSKIVACDHINKAIVNLHHDGVVEPLLVDLFNSVEDDCNTNKETTEEHQDGAEKSALYDLLDQITSQHMRSLEGSPLSNSVLNSITEVYGEAMRHEHDDAMIFHPETDKCEINDQVIQEHVASHENWKGNESKNSQSSSNDDVKNTNTSNEYTETAQKLFEGDSVLMSTKCALTGNPVDTSDTLSPDNSHNENCNSSPADFVVLDSWDMSPDVKDMAYSGINEPGIHSAAVIHQGVSIIDVPSNSPNGIVEMPDSGIGDSIESINTSILNTDAKEENAVADSSSGSTGPYRVHTSPISDSDDPPQAYQQRDADISSLATTDSSHREVIKSVSSKETIFDFTEFLINSISKEGSHNSGISYSNASPSENTNSTNICNKSSTTPPVFHSDLSNSSLQFQMEDSNESISENENSSHLDGTNLVSSLSNHCPSLLSHKHNGTIKSPDTSNFVKNCSFCLVPNRNSKKSDTSRKRHSVMPDGPVKKKNLQTRRKKSHHEKCSNNKPTHNGGLTDVLINSEPYRTHSNHVDSGTPNKNSINRTEILQLHVKNSQTPTSSKDKVPATTCNGITDSLHSVIRSKSEDSFTNESSLFNDCFDKPDHKDSGTQNGNNIGTDSLDNLNTMTFDSDEEISEVCSSALNSNNSSNPQHSGIPVTMDKQNSKPFDITQSSEQQQEIKRRYKNRDNPLVPLVKSNKNPFSLDWGKVKL